MKYLSDYTNEAQTELFKEKWVFFAFWKNQFNEQKKEGVTYVSAWHGMFCPKGELMNVLNSIDEIQSSAIKKDIDENGIDGIIRRELYNHECFYTGDISNAVSFLEQYWITEEQVDKIYIIERAKENNN